MLAQERFCFNDFLGLAIARVFPDVNRLISKDFSSIGKAPVPARYARPRSLPLRGTLASGDIAVQKRGSRTVRRRGILEERRAEDETWVPFGANKMKNGTWLR